MSTLTERYLHAVTRTLDADTAADVRAELIAAIDDALDARRELGETPAAAERAVLTELGDPGILAAGYADRRLQLIGPRYYPLWRRLLRLLLAIVPASVGGAVALGAAIEGAGVGAIAAQAITAALSTAVHVCFWLTLVFAILERTGTDLGAGWDVDQLPELPTTQPVRGEARGSLIFLAVCAVALLWDRLIGFVFIDGAAIPVLAPELWPLSGGAFLLLVVFEAMLEIAVVRRGAWTLTHAVVNTVIALVALSLALTLLTRGLLVNPQFVAALFTANGVTDDTVRILGILTGFALLGIAATDIAGGWIRCARANRS